MATQWALVTFASDDAEGQLRLTAFREGLRQLGWTEGSNVGIDTRWVAGDPDRSQIRGGIVDPRA